jgi:hypothetical protein
MDNAIVLKIKTGKIAIDQHRTSRERTACSMGRKTVAGL